VDLETRAKSLDNIADAYRFTIFTSPLQISFAL
jgi:hypothetical protein